MRCGPAIVPTSLVLACMTCGGPAALAQEAPPPALRLPIAHVDRPLTLPKLVMAPSLDGSFEQAAAVTTTATSVMTPGGPMVAYELHDTTTPAWGLAPAFRIGATDDLEAHAQAPFVLEESRVDLTVLSAGVTYRFVRGPMLEMGVGGDVLWYPQGSAGVGQTVALPMRLHLGHVVRVDTAPTLTLAERDDMTVSVAVPLTVAVQVVDAFYLGATTGVRRTLSSDSPNSPDLSATLAFPLGFFAGFTLAGTHGPVLDLHPYVTWNDLATPNGTPTTTTNVLAGGNVFAAPEASATTHTDRYRVGLTATGYFYL